MEDFTILNKTVLLCAKRNSGKSRLLRYLVLCEKDKFDKLFVICPTECVNNFYEGITTKDCIFDEYNDDWVLKLINKMTDIKAQKINKNVLIILDDAVADSDMHFQKGLKILYARGRHINVSIIVTTQYINSISPLMRSNSDYVFLGQQNKRSIDIIADEYLSGDIEKPEFIKLFNKSTRDFNFFVINCNSVKNNDDLNCIYGSIKTPPEYIK